jgi:release factor glutamine methyltransferase
MADPAPVSIPKTAGPPLLLDLVKRSGDFLRGKGIANGRREAEWIFAETLGLQRIDLYTRYDMPLDAAEVERLRTLIMRRARREPLAYVLGNLEFHGLTLQVGPGVLVPRPETAELVDRLLAELPPPTPEVVPRLLDVGTGSGAIALALKQARPDCAVLASDREETALARARANAGCLGLALEFAHGHLATHLQGPFAAIAANLPYIGEHERADCDPELAYEPQVALFAADGGLALISELLADARRLLAPTGLLWLEHGWKQGPAVRARAASLGLACTTISDAGGRERIARISVP